MPRCHLLEREGRDTCATQWARLRSTPGPSRASREGSVGNRCLWGLAPGHNSQAEGTNVRLSPSVSPRSLLEVAGPLVTCVLRAGSSRDPAPRALLWLRPLRREDPGGIADRRFGGSAQNSNALIFHSGSYGSCCAMQKRDHIFLGLREPLGLAPKVPALALSAGG